MSQNINAPSLNKSMTDINNWIQLGLTGEAVALAIINHFKSVHGKTDDEMLAAAKQMNIADTAKIEELMRKSTVTAAPASAKNPTGVA